MGIEKAFKDSFHQFKDNLIFILPHFFEYIIDFALIFAFVILAILVVGMGLLRATFSSVYNPQALASHLGASGFLVAFLLILMIAVLMLATVFLSASARTAIIGMAKEGMESKKISLRTGGVNVREHGLKVFGFIMLLGIILIPLVFVGFFPTMIVSFLNGRGFVWVTSLLLSTLLTLLLVGIVYISMMFTPQCIVLESLGITDGVKRSYTFVKSNAFMVFEYIIIVIVISLLVYGGTSIVFYPMKFILRGSSIGRLAVTIFENFFSFLIGLLLSPYFEIVKTNMVAEWNPQGTID